MSHHPPPAANTGPIVSLNRVSKRFPGVIANEGIDLALWAGEVHVLLGENGAGKSTLVAMLAGLQQPDEGSISVNGRIEALTSPRRALAFGIGTVFQHTMLVPGLSVVENIALGDSWWRRPARRAYAQRINDIAQDIGVRVDPFARAGSLSLGEQQQAEIVRALLRGSRVLLLDEATAMLTPQNAADLGQLMRRLVAQGLAVVFITHKLNEALAWGDRITVLRRGRKVGEIPPQRLRTLSDEQATGEVMQMMFNLSADSRAPSADGGETVFPADAPTPNGSGMKPASSAPSGEPVLDIRDLSAADPLVPIRHIGFQVHAGEILGVAGIDGNGQKQLAEALAGQRPLASGRIFLGGKAIGHLGVARRREHGLRYVTDDRLGEGIVGAFPVAVNLLLKQIGEPPYWRKGIVQPAAIAALARARIEEYDIRTPAADTPVGTLSGGNIQKVLLARELSDQARVVIFAKPTHGLDVRNTLSIRRRIRQAARDGMAIILISTDLEEVLALSDRVAVMSRGRITGMVVNDARARDRIGRLMSGGAL